MSDQESKELEQKGDLSDKLLPCPFCNCKDIRIEGGDSDEYLWRWCGVYCSSCGITYSRKNLPNDSGRQSAINSWNKRAESEQLTTTQQNLESCQRVATELLAIKQQALDTAKAAISKMRILADEVREFITARPANKPRANMCLLKIQQMSVFPVEEEAEMNKIAKEFVTELAASKQLDSAVEALRKAKSFISGQLNQTGGNGTRTIGVTELCRLEMLLKAALASIKE